MGQNLAMEFQIFEIFEPLCLTGQQQPQKNFIQQHGNEYLTCPKALEEFVNSLEAPHSYGTSRKAVDAVIENLLPYLETGDIILTAEILIFRHHSPRKELQEKEFASWAVESLAEKKAH